MSMEHVFLMTRIEDGVLEAAATIQLLSDEDLESSEAWDRFRRTVTRWVKETPAGAACWKDSVQNLNVGYLLNHMAEHNLAFYDIAAHEGLKVRLHSHNSWAFQMSYDEVLVDEEELADPDEEGEE